MFVDETKYINRLNVCKNCEYNIKKLNINTCGKCGCVIRFKAKFITSDCPLYKWDKEENK